MAVKDAETSEQAATETADGDDEAHELWKHSRLTTEAHQTIESALHDWLMKLGLLLIAGDREDVLSGVMEDWHGPFAVADYEAKYQEVQALIEAPIEWRI